MDFSQKAVCSAYFFGSFLGKSTSVPCLTILSCLSEAEKIPSKREPPEPPTPYASPEE